MSYAKIVLFRQGFKYYFNYETYKHITKSKGYWLLRSARKAAHERAKTMKVRFLDYE